jgi:hypothetical protein
MPTFTDHSHIRGWGADVNPSSRPAYPKERMPARWSLPEPEQQIQNVPILHSTERPGITPVFGTVCPPKGLSGAMRKFGFRYSENDVRHWLILLAADRVNVFEGLFEDLARGHVPNIFAEMGIRAEWKYNKKGLLMKTAAVGAAVGLAAYLVSRRRANR